MIRFAATITLAIVGLLPSARAQSDALRMVKSLSVADPFNDSSPTSNLVSATGAVEAAIRAAAHDSKTDAPIRGRALRLVLAWDLADRVRAHETQPDLSAWLALDELDQLFTLRPRAALLARAFTAPEQRDKALAALGEAREIARRFCHDWNENVVSGDKAKESEYADLKVSLVGAGTATAPYLFGILCVPQDVAFQFTDPHTGPEPTARQQVRALYALAFLRLSAAAPYFVLHSQGPSFTETTTAESVLSALAGLDLSASKDPQARAKLVTDWWSTQRDQHALVLDHLVRGTLRWTRSAIGSSEVRIRESWHSGPAELARLAGPAFQCPADGDASTLRARVDALEDAWLRK
jgi:hypothetical protein